MPQPDHVMALPVPDPATLDDDMRAYFAKCTEKLGFVPNVLQAYSARQRKLRTFAQFYNELMLGESGLSKLEREMIAVVVSSANHCYYCLVAHGQAVRKLSGDPELGEMLVANYRVAPLAHRQRAMLDFAWKLTKEPWTVDEADRQALRDAGFSAEEIFDIADVTGFYNMSNRVATAVDMIPNREYHGQDR
ncbi:peroxidase-related enzyme [Azospirillum sp. A39]|uniref:peroxidase-related enzyme n=1 Tax=Azospirillum sp. A39 TaxID=3462279 RepID=UPI00404524C3